MNKRVFFLILFSALSITFSSGQKNNKNITITGIVLDVARDPIVNAIIMIDDKKTSSVTDSRGYYKIKVRPDAVKIGIFTFANGLSEETISGRRRINLTTRTLSSVNQGDYNTVAEEEEINIGYGTIKKKNLTNSVSKIDGTNKRYASYNSIYDMIRGEIAGVQVQGKSIKIQGANSYYLSTEPLIVVDGINVSSIDDIQPQIVKSIEVLKGSSAAIYGSRGANGVILITLIGAPVMK